MLGAFSDREDKRIGGAHVVGDDNTPVEFQAGSLGEGEGALRRSVIAGRGSRERCRPDHSLAGDVAA